MSDPEAALKKMRDMSPDALKAHLREKFIAAATADVPTNPSYLPLFKRGGLKDSPEMQNALADIAAEYLNILLVQCDAVLEQKKIKKEIQQEISIIATLYQAGDPTMADIIKQKNDELLKLRHHCLRYEHIDALTTKELGAWNVHAKRKLLHYPDELLAYAKSAGGGGLPVGQYAESIVGATVKLAIHELMPKITEGLASYQGTIDTEEDLHVAMSFDPHAAAWAYVQAMIQRGVDKDGREFTDTELKSKALDLVMSQQAPLGRY